MGSLGMFGDKKDVLKYLSQDSHHTTRLLESTAMCHKRSLSREKIPSSTIDPYKHITHMSLYYILSRPHLHMVQPYTHELMPMSHGNLPSADRLPISQAHDVQVVVPLLLDVGRGEAGCAQRLLGLIVGGFAQPRHDKGSLLNTKDGG